jgi:hypothetical protein
MRTVRKLALKREALFELSSAELQQVAGGAQTIWRCHVSNAIDPCPTRTNIVCDRISVIIHPCPTDICP